MLLKRIYRGSVRPGEEYRLSDRYWKKQNVLCENQKKLLNSVSESEKNALLNIWSEMNALSALEVEEAYVSGMRLGAKLALELMKE